MHQARFGAGFDAANAAPADRRDAHAKGFVDRLPGYHGKGAYTGQGRVVVANNGERQGPYTLLYDQAGCLAEWVQGRWNVIEEKQFCEVTGPGGIEGNACDDDPV